MKKILFGSAVLIALLSVVWIGSKVTAQANLGTQSSGPLTSSTFVLSQVAPGGGGSTGTYLFDYVEIKNISGSAQSLNGLSIYYGSATGNFASAATNAFALPNVSLNPGQYYLVQLGTAGTAGAPLPVTPDATNTTIAMSATSGKVALVNAANFPINTCGATATPCNTAQLAVIVDWVAYGTGGNGPAGNGEGGTSVNNGAAITASQGAVRKTGGCTETDNNNLDFDVVTAPVPRNNSSPATPCASGTPTPTPTPSPTPVGTPTPTPSPTPVLTPTPTPSPTPTPDPADDPLQFGNPSNATSNIANENNYLMPKYQYTISYNRSKAEPNWVAWRLDSSWIGTTSRQDDYRPDPAVPASWYQVTPADYSEPVYDRGHMCPSGDRTNSVANNSATFLMTNFVPQLPANNQGPWEDFESYCRTVAAQGNELYIISGPSGNIGTIGNGVVIPSVTWKVVLILPNGTNDVQRVSRATRAFGIIVPNQASGVNINDVWRKYRVTVDAVEYLTGYDFFSAIPKNTQEIIERRRDKQ